MVVPVSRLSVLLAVPVAATLLMSGMVLADPETVRHHPVHRAVGHAHAALKRLAEHPARAGHPAPAARHAPAPAPAAATVAPPVSPAAVVPPAASRGTSTGLPLPRFAALRADSVYMRRGPGSRYPIEWVYKRRDLPVEIEREFDVWRLIEDPDGIKGWVHQATLVGTRSFVIPGPVSDGTVETATPPAETSVAAAGGPAAMDPSPPGSRVLRRAPQPDAAPVAVLEPGVIGRLRTCAAGAGWCRVTVGDYNGWLPRQAVWGLLPDEAIPSP